jgi:hypothetical protein
MGYPVALFALLGIVSATPIPPSQDSPKLALYDRTQRLCEGLALSSPEFAENIEGSGVSSLRDVCECTALLSVAPLAQDKAIELMSADAGRDGFITTMSAQFKHCVALNVAK